MRYSIYLSYPIICLLSLSSCEAGKSAVEETTDLPVSIPTEGIVPSHLQPLYDIIEAMQGLMEEFKADPIKEALKGETLASYQCFLEDGEKFVHTAALKTDKLSQQEITSDEYLRFLLHERLSALEGRTLMINEKLAEDGNTLLIVPTSQVLFDHINEDKRGIALKYDKRMRTEAISRIEFLSLLIKEILLICKDIAFSDETYRLLQSSVQLHPFLTGARKDIPHPDECVAPYAILEAVLFKKTTLDQEYNAHTEELRKLRKIPRRNESSILIIEEPFAKNIGILRNLYRDITNKNKRDKRVKEANLYLSRNLDVPMYRGHLPNVQQVKDDKGQITSQAYMSTQYQEKVWPYPLPDLSPIIQAIHPTPLLETQTTTQKAVTYKKKRKKGRGRRPALQSQGQQAVSSIALERSSTVDIHNYQPPTVISENDVVSLTTTPLLPSSNQPLNPGIATLPVSEETIPKAVSIVQEPIQKTTTISSPLPLTLEEAPSPTIIEDVLADQKQAHLKGPRKEIGKIAPPIHKTPQEEEQQPSAPQTLSREPAKKQALSWTSPRGVRTFHSHMPLPMASSPNAGKHQITVDRLFDTQQQCRVKFKDFKNLWVAIEGNIITNGGGSSHHVLVSPEGQKVGGIFSKGNGTVYGKTSIRYLQDAALRVGLRPTTFIENL